MIILIIWLLAYPVLMKYIQIMNEKQLHRKNTDEELKKIELQERFLYLIVSIILLLYNILIKILELLL